MRSLLDVSRPHYTSCCSFQAANNAAVMSAATADRRGVVSSLLSLARNLGLVTGASAMSRSISICIACSITNAEVNVVRNSAAGVTEGAVEVAVRDFI